MTTTELNSVLFIDSALEEAGRPDHFLCSEEVGVTQCDELRSPFQINIPSKKINGKVNSMSETEDVKRFLSHQ